MQPDRITIHEVMRRINAHEKLVFVDARDAASWANSEELIGGATRVPPTDVAAHTGRLPGNPLIVYCDSPHQQTSMNVARDLASRGFHEVRVLDGGFDAWKQARGWIVAKPAGGDVRLRSPTLPETPQAHAKAPSRIPTEGVAGEGEPSTPMERIPSPHHRPSHA
jgi:rhodanese-related sulfurtransferase